MPPTRLKSGEGATGWVLVLDQGGHATRALVFDGAGTERARAEKAIGTHRSGPGQVEHDAAELMESVRFCLDGIASQLGNAVQQLTGAALCTQRSSIVCWSRRDARALSPVLSWQDVRAGGLLARLCPDEAIVREITGLRPSEHYGASKIRWCLDGIPAVQDAQASGDLVVGPLASFLVCHLSRGEMVAVDPCNASRTLLWDMRSRDWSQVLLSAFEIPREVLPRCARNREQWTAIAFGDRHVPLEIVTGDQSAVPFAFDPNAGRALLTLGTGAFLQLPGGAPSHCPGLLDSVIFHDGEATGYALEGTVNGAGSALAWFAKEARLAEASLLDELPAWLQHVSSPPLFLNAVGGLAAPFWRPRMQSRFEGAGDLAARAVAVVESIAFLVTANLEAMRRCGRRVDEIIAVGGLSRLDGLMTRLSALAGVHVCRASNLEATAYGGARLVQPGLPPLEVRDCVPLELDREALRERYARWLGAMPATAG